MNKFKEEYDQGPEQWKGGESVVIYLAYLLGLGITPQRSLSW